MEILLGICLGLLLVALWILWLLFHRTSKHPENTVVRTLQDELRQARKDSSDAARELREELARAQKSGAELVITAVSEMGKTQKEAVDSVVHEIKTLTGSNERRLDGLRETVDKKLQQIQQTNEAKLEEMRRTVDEKLHDTLEKRLGESFKLVSKQLEAVQSGLGEMRSLAVGVGDLKKVLSNVKTRGMLGEIQLGAILEEILISEQFEKNVQVKGDSSERVEYAIKLPGPTGSENQCVWLPIDSKFPQEDYQRLVDAADEGNSEGVRMAVASLVRGVKGAAKEVRDKYLDPPNTTDFAIMFLPTEGLYAEILRQPGLVEELMRANRIVVAGPTTLAAILSSLRMGFQTLAIEKRSSEVWQILAAVKSEFGKFGGVLDKLKRQLKTATKTVDQTATRTRVMERKLRQVEQLPEIASERLLELDSLGPGSRNQEILMEEDDEGH